eukprot:5209217-Alexandrium_andersonii.AAC.1
MSASLVGSEMCIRDRNTAQNCPGNIGKRPDHRGDPASSRPKLAGTRPKTCLLYTSDAADDM